MLQIPVDEGQQATGGRIQPVEVEAPPELTPGFSGRTVAGEPGAQDELLLGRGPVVGARRAHHGASPARRRSSSRVGCWVFNGNAVLTQSLIALDPMQTWVR